MISENYIFVCICVHVPQCLWIENHVRKLLFSNMNSPSSILVFGSVALQLHPLKMNLLPHTIDVRNGHMSCFDKWVERDSLPVQTPVLELLASPDQNIPRLEPILKTGAPSQIQTDQLKCLLTIQVCSSLLHSKLTRAD